MKTPRNTMLFRVRGVLAGGLLLCGLPAAPAATLTTVKGTIVYGNIIETAERDLSDADAAVFDRGLKAGQPIPHVTVALRNGWLAYEGEGEVVTGPDGSFEITVSGSPDTLVLVVKAKNDYVKVRKFGRGIVGCIDVDDVLKTETDVRDQVNLEGGTETIENNIVVVSDNTDTYDVDGVVNYVSRGFYICGAAQVSAENIHALTGETLPSVNVRLGIVKADLDLGSLIVDLTVGGAAGEIFEWFFPDTILSWPPGESATAFFWQLCDTIYLANTDAETFYHEYGHFIEDKLAAFALVPCYFSHGSCKQMETTLTDNPNLCWAWLEGLATWLGAINSASLHGWPADVVCASDWDGDDDVDDNDTYLCERAAYLSRLGYAHDIETNKCSDESKEEWTDARAVESVVANVLWDLTDSAEEPADSLLYPVPEIAQVSVEDVLEVIRKPLRDLKDETGLDLDNSPCGLLEFNSKLMGLDQFWLAWRALHPGPVPDLYSAYAHNHVALDDAEDFYGPYEITLTSSTHDRNVWSNKPRVTLTVEDGYDDVSGSYYYAFQATETSDPDPSFDVRSDCNQCDKCSKETQFDYEMSLNDGASWYIHARSRDLAGHLDNRESYYGPIKIDTTPPYWIPDDLDFAVKDLYLIGQYVHFEWAAGDALSGVSRIEIVYSDPVNGIAGLPALRSYSASGSVEYYLDPDLVRPTTGGHFTVTVYDVAGNHLSTETEDFQVVSPFTGPTDLAMPLDQGRVVCGDLNGDGKDEIVISGMEGLARTLRIIQVSPALVVQNLAPGLAGGDLFLADIDRDGDLDLIAAGDFGGAGPEIYRFQNNGAGGFVSLGPLAIPTLADLVVRVVDLYGTGEPILVYGGRAGAGTQRLRAYHLQTGGAVAPLDGTFFRGGDFEVGDINADGIFDFVTLSSDSAGNGHIEWYLGQTQENQLSWALGGGTSVVSPQIGDLDLGNWDLDNDLELFVMYRGTTAAGVVQDQSELWEWNGSTFVLAIGAGGVNRIAEGDGHIVEIYNDGKSDVFALGRQVSGTVSSWYVTNEELGRQSSGTPYPVRVNPLYDTDTAWGDFDNDGDLDVVITGAGVGGLRRTIWYENQVSQYSKANADPPAPISLQSTYDAVRGGYVLSWEAPGANTDETVEAAFEYEVRVGTTPGASDIVSWAHPAGHGQQVAPQPVGVRFERFVPMAAGALDWCVRTVDNGWRRSGCLVPGPGAFEAGLPPDTIVAGTTPPFVSGGVLHLTDAVNDQANYWITPLTPRTVQSVSAKWKTLIGGGGDTNNGALGGDGFSFSLGTDLGTSYIPEEGAANGLIVAVDTFDNGAALEVGLEIKWNGQQVAFSRSGDGGNTAAAKAPLRRNEFLDTTLEVTAGGAATFSYAGLTVNGTLPDYRGIVADQYVFAARTGLANDNHWLDDVAVHLVEASGVDLQVAFQPLPAQIIEGDTISVSLTASNAGPATATGVQVTTAIPAGFTLLSATGSQGGCQAQGGEVLCDLATLNAGQSATVQLSLAVEALPSDAAEFENLSDLTCAASATESDLNPTNNHAATRVTVWVERDFPDAPDASIASTYAYPTVLADNAARHRLTGPYFGGSAPASGRDGDADGQPSLDADGDDLSDANDDEAGITFLDPLMPGATGVRVRIEAPLGGVVDAWVDFGRDGTWSMAPSPEQILISVPVAAGVGNYTFDVPAGVTPGTTYARFRISTAGGLAFTGYATDGEAQDHKIAIVPLPGQSCTDFAQGLPAGSLVAGTPPAYVAGGVLHLTDAANDQAGYWITPLSLQLVQSMNARWKVLIGGGSQTGADGVSFNLGTDLGTTFIAEEGAINGLSANVDTWDNGGEEVGLEIKWNGQRVGFTRVGDGTTAAQAPLRLNQFVNASLEVTAAGTATFTYAGFTVSAQLPGYRGIVANQYVLAARTGGANDRHWIDDLCVQLQSEACTDFAQGLPAGTIAAGATPPFVIGGVLHLTDATNDQAGYWITPIRSQMVGSLTAHWKTLIGGGGDPNDGSKGADGLSFNLGKDLGTSFLAEEGAEQGLNVAVDTYHNGDFEVGLELKWNGQRVAFTRSGDGGNTASAKAPLRRGEFLDTSLDVTSAGLVTFSYAGLSVIGQLPNYQGIAANQYVFAARTGGANDNHWIDDLCIDLVELPRVDLTVIAVPSTFVIGEGDPVSLTLVASNKGPSTATSVLLEIHLPPGGILQSVTSSQGSCQLEGTNLNCRVSSLAAGQRFLVRFTMDTGSIFDHVSDEFMDFCWGITAAEIDLNPADNMEHPMLRVIAKRDFADAPDTSIAPTFLYPTVSADNGPRHRIVGPYFGDGPAGVVQSDPDPDGMPSLNADGDDVSDANDDEEGIQFLDPFYPGATGVRVRIDAPLGGVCDAWIDFNRNGVWTMGAPEQIFTSLALTPGTFDYTFNVPAGAVLGSTYARFRVSTGGGLAFTGYATNGEVEDYKVEILPKPGEPPVVLLTSPADGSSFAAGTPVTLSAVASASGGKVIVSVSFRDRGELVGQVSSPPYSLTLPSLAGGSHVFTAVATDNEGLSTTSSPVNIAIQEAPTPPTILAQPVDQTIEAGESVTFRVIATGSAPLAYQWRFNGTDLPGQSGSNLTINNVQTSQAGAYSVSVGNAFGQVISTSATLTVTTPRPDLALLAFLSPPVLTENIAAILTVIGTNYRPASAGSVLLDIRAPVGLRIQAVSNSLGTCQLLGNSNVVCSVASLAGNSAFTVELTVRPNFLPEQSNEFENLSDLTAVISSSNADSNPADNALTLPITVRAQTDWADARGGFPVTAAENGPYHRYSANAPWLGIRWDNDGNGVHSLLADWDDTHGASDDEDGLVFPEALVAGRMAAAIVTCANAPGFLDAWADFNNDGDWNDSGEQIAMSRPLLPGPNTLTFTVPATAVPGPITTRWRVSATGGLSYTGYGGTGEAEDHPATVVAPPTVFSGLPHLALGSATVSSSAAGLQISNLGSSGQDGVSIDLRELSRKVSLGFGSNGFTFAGSARLKVGAYGTVSGTPDQFLGSVSFSRSNDVLSGVWTFDVLVVAPSRRIEVYNGVTLIGTYPVPSDGSLGTLSGDVRLTEVSFVAETGQEAFWDWCWWPVTYSPPGQSSTTLEATRLRLVQVGSADQIDNLARLEVTGANLDSLLIEQETAPQFQPALRIEMTGQQLDLKWDTRTSVLQCAPTVNGPWTTIAEGTAAITLAVNTVDPSRYYRVVVPDWLRECVVDRGQNSNYVCRRNILLLVADDVGVDQIQWYINHYGSSSIASSNRITVERASSVPARTPVISRLADAGVTFLNAWSSPVCSPTRACLLTGNHSFRHGVYSPLHPNLPYPTTTIASVLHDAGYANGLFGKWHLGDPGATVPGYRPTDYFWDCHYGVLGGDLVSYYGWDKVEVNPAIGLDRAIGVIGDSHYATRENVGDALDWIRTRTGPWMATVAFNAPHSPFEFPPDDCVYQSRTDTTDRSKYRSMLECLDISINALLSGIPTDTLEQTTIIFLGDNGTPREITEHFTEDNYPSYGTVNHAKDSVFRGGVNVPMIIADGYTYRHPGEESPVEKGKGRVVSPGRVESALVQTLDIFATAAEIGRGVVSSSEDSISLVPYLESATPSPLRQYIFAESRPTKMDGTFYWKMDEDTGWHLTIQDDTHKLIVWDYGSASEDYDLYNIVDDFWETADLWDSTDDDIVEIRDSLKAAIDTLLGDSAIP